MTDGRHRARRLAAQLARRGLDVPPVENLRDLLDLLDPDGDEDGLVEQVADWIDAVCCESEARDFAAAVIARARGARRQRQI